MKIERAYFISLMVSIAALVMLFFFHGKWSAEWWGIPVILFAVGSSIITYLGFGQLRYFKVVNRYSNPSKRSYITCIIGLIICMIVGPYYTEPVANDGWYESRTVQKDDSYNYRNSRAGYWYYHSSYYSSGPSSGSGGFSMPDVDVDGEGAAYLAILIFVIFLVAMTFLVAHFWMVSCMCIITLMLMLYLRESELNNKTNN